MIFIPEQRLSILCGPLPRAELGGRSSHPSHMHVPVGMLCSGLPLALLCYRPTILLRRSFVTETPTAAIVERPLTWESAAQFKFANEYKLVVRFAVKCSG